MAATAKTVAMAMLMSASIDGTEHFLLTPINISKAMTTTHAIAVCYEIAPTILHGCSSIRALAFKSVRQDDRGPNIDQTTRKCLVVGF